MTVKSKLAEFFFRSETNLISLSTDESTWFVGITALAMTAGVLLSIPISEKIGRKRVFITSNIFSVLGYLIIFFTPSFLLLMLGRITQCFGMGLGAITLGVFLSEITTVSMRGPLIGISATACVIGQLVGSFLCIFIPIQFFSIVLASHSLMTSFLLIFLPGSPHWLIRNSKEEEAKRSIQFLRGNKYVGIDLELTEIKKCTVDRQKNSSESMNSRTFLMPLMTFIVVFAMLGTCGNDTFLFYGPTIFSLIDVGIPAGVLSTLPWIGFSIGYAGMGLESQGYVTIFMK